MQQIKLQIILSVDTALQALGNALLSLSDRWLYATTANSPLEQLMKESRN